ncbi:MAG: ribosome-binding factor A [Acidimicrobiia bacterium]|nr:ribosome-binding factor A [Acidimicrobiia bacterium]
MARKPRRGQGGRGSRPGRSKRPATNRQFPRTARLNTLLHEIVADYFERIDDERFDLLTVTGVEVDSDLNRAQVFVTTLGSVASDPIGTGPARRPFSGAPDADAELLEALSSHRRAVQRKIGQEARIRKIPEVVFAVDQGVRSGARIEEILATLEAQANGSNNSDAGNADDGRHGVPVHDDEEGV